MAHVVLSRLEKSYPEKSGPGLRVVHGIDLEIRAGEFMVLVGPSGCGKSTTLRMIAGLEDISGGSISIDGRVVNDVAPKDRDIAMVFQNYALYPHMTVYENMAFGLKLRKLPRPEIDRRVREASALLSLDAYLERRPKALSGGQRQRVAVGRAIVRQPKVFLFDEPLSNLDAKMRVSTRAEISRLHARLGATMIYVTHDQVEAMTMGDRICVMKDGRIMQVAAPLELYHRPDNVFVAGFIGSPPMNLFPGRLEKSAGGDRLDFIGAGPTPLRVPLDARLSALGAPLAGREVVFGARPEDVLHADDAPSAPAAEARVEISEPMGAETYLHLTIGPSPCVARVRPDLRLAPGETVRVAFRLDAAHLFDAADGRALR